MSFLIYQRSDPRSKDWLPLLTQQIRLRNVIQIVGLNLQVESGEDEVFFTLHTRAMSTPFFTSEKQRTRRRVVVWKEIEPRQIPESVRLSAPGCVVRVWSSSPTSQQKPLTSWALYFQGLHYWGYRGDWNTRDFKSNTLLIRMPFGYFVALDTLIKPLLSPQRFLQLELPMGQVRNSYSVKSLAALHSVQRTVLEVAKEAQDLKAKISLYGYSLEVGGGSSFHSSLILSEKALARVRQGRRKLELKEQIENMRLRASILKSEKEQSLQRLGKAKKDSIAYDDMTMDLLGRMQNLGRDKERLKELKVAVQEKKSQLTNLSAQLFRRKKELISELLLIYPLSLVEGSKKYSINEIQLPNAEDYGNESGGQVSVALGYSAHLTAMLSFFLGIPLRYPIRHFGSLSRIVDHITVQIPDKEREFPLYFRNKEDVYSKYAVYLLNKNIAQIRWYCGLSTVELRATLPNLYNLLTARLTIPGWPPSPTESLEVAQELTEEVDPQLFRTESSVSLDKGLDQLVPPEKAIENAWLRSSFSDLECAGNNVVPAGEVQHGKAQDRFLNGWRKKTYESEDIDPRWLTNSLNLDFDGGRRLSTSSNSSASHRPPLILVSEDGKQVRKRRFGRVEPNLSRRGSGSASFGNNSPEPTTETPMASTPNDSMNQLEKHIKRLEHKRSFCGVPGSDRGEGTPSPTAEKAPEIDLVPEVKREEDTFDDVADTTRKISLVEMQLHRRQVLEETEEILDIVDSETREHLTTKYDHSSDERGGSPSPAFIRRVSHDVTPTNTPYTTGHESRKHPSVVNEGDEEPTSGSEELNPLNLPIDRDVTFDTSYNIQVPIASATLDSDRSDDGSIASAIENGTTVHQDQEHKEVANVPITADALNNCDIAEEYDDVDFGDSDALWLRTEALLSSTKSFNMVKRRVSEPN